MNAAVPRFHTERDRSRRTLGGKAARLSAALGKPFMPWQRMAADVALEVDHRGRFVYKTVVITVPRQSGKTAMIMALGLHRTLTTPRGKTWYTAQTGYHARERFLKDMADDAERLLPSVINVKRGAGDTRLNFPAIGGQFRPHPPNDTSLHSEQSDLNIIDEPWSLTELQGDGLMQAILPTQNTRPNAQSIYLSTMGDARSTWWHRMVDEARAGDDPRTCIIDWGLPEAEDPSDVEAVIAAHPAVGHTIEPDVIRVAHAKMKPAEFARAYANRRTSTRIAVFDGATLARVIRDDATMTADSPIAFGVAVSWDRSRAAIVAAGFASDGTPVIETIDARPGSGWVTERLAELNRHDPLAVLVDARSPASTIAADPAAEDIITIPDSRAVAAGTSDFLDRVASGNVRIRRDSEMVASFDALALRVVGDLGQMLDRKHNSGSIAHVEAAMLALTALTQAPAPAPAPMIWS